MPPEERPRTGIHQEVLDRYCNEVPGASRFLQNFFGTCQPFAYEDNWSNYQMDLDLYSPTSRAIQQHRRTLMRAFGEIAYPINPDNQRQQEGQNL